MSSPILRIATRKSPLALWQASYVGELLKNHYPALKYELLPLVTSGDKFLKDKLQDVGGKGLFVKELEEAILDNRADIAVHSLKDVPAHLPPPLALGGICKRDNPYDAFVSEKFPNLESLPPGAIIGTSSLRRETQLRIWRSDLTIAPLRGNINTRLEKLKKNEYDGIILAAAGLERLGLKHEIKELIAEDIMLPACGQGALGVECRKSALPFLELLQSIHDPLTAYCTSVERLVNLKLGGNCHVPLAVFCKPTIDKKLFLQAKLVSADCKTILEFKKTKAIHQYEALALNCAEFLFAQGAQKLLDSHV